MWALAVPIILSNLSVPLLGAVDTAVMGHQDAAYFLGAIATGALLFSYIYWGFGFLRMSTTAFTAQALGGGRPVEVLASLFRPLLLALVLGLVLMLFARPIGALGFSLIDASPEVERLGRLYFSLRILSAPAALANFALIGWLFGTRRATLALALQSGMNALNIVLDIYFVVYLGWGIRGVALATVIAEYSVVLVAFIVIAVVLWRRPAQRHLAAAAFGRLFDGQALGHMFVVNRDIFVRTLFLVSAFAVFTALGARFGDTVLAANAILLSLQTFLSYGLDGFAHAAEALIGDAIGARDRAAFRRMVAVSTEWALGTALLFTLIYLFWGSSLIGLMTSLDEVRAMAGRLMPWIIASPLISVWSYQLDGIFNGALRSRAMRRGMIEAFVFYIVALIILVPLFGNNGLWAAFLLFMAARALTLGLRYRTMENAVLGDRPNR